MANLSIYKDVIKRIFDFIVSSILLLLLLPIFLLSTIVLFIANKGNPFFIQPRPGKDEKIFNIIKFKTMSDRVDQFGNLLPDADRLTTIGKFIRKMSIDEIPQLINIIKGDMSLVGPRPLLVSYLPLYNAEQRKRHLVKPGITGLAQVNGRNTIGWTKKFEYDVWYINNVNFTLDIRILFLTIIKTFKSEGINSFSAVTMEAFKGGD